MKQHHNKSASAAFTVIELIVIVTVISILLSVVYVGYGSWRNRVAQAELRSDLLGVQAGMEDVRNLGNGYPTFTAGTQFDGVNTTKSVFTQSQHVTLTYIRGNSTSYCVNAQSLAVAGLSMFLDTATSNKSPQTGTC